MCFREERLGTFIKTPSSVIQNRRSIKQFLLEFKIILKITVLLSHGRLRCYT